MHFVALGLLLASVTTIGMFWFSHIPTDQAESVRASAASALDIDPREVSLALGDGSAVTLLDVRTPAEHAASHLERSILVPLDELSAESLAARGIDTLDTIYVYCRSGNRSTQAYHLLSALGYKNVKNVTGGINLWQALSLPYLTSGSN